MFHKPAKDDTTQENTVQKKDRGDRSTLYSVLILALCFLLVLGLLIMVASPKRHDIQVGEPAPETIKATKDIEDKIATEHLRELAAESLDEGIMRKDAAVAELSLNLLDDYISSMRRARTTYKNALLATPTPTPVPIPAPTPVVTIDAEGNEVPVVPEEETTPTPSPTAKPTPTPDPQEVAMENLTSTLGALNFSQKELASIITIDDNSFETMADVLRQMVQQIMEEGVRDGELAEKRQEISLQLIGRGVDSELLSAANALGTFVLRENVFIDSEATEVEREQLAQAVEAVVYKKGQNIVQAGEVVTEQQYAMLSELGLLQHESADAYMYIGMSLLVLLMFFTVLIYLYQFERELLRQPKMILLLSVITLLQLAVGLAVRTLNEYLIPVQLGAILIALLLRPGLAMVMNMVLGVCAGVMATGEDGLMAAPMIQLLLLTLFVGAMAIYIARRTSRRSQLLYSGFLIGALNFICIVSSGVLISTNFNESLQNGLMVAIGGLLSVVLAVGVLPLLETLFNLLTPQILLELSTPTQPLLRQLQTEAPGTYHHSILVANLAEAAADQIGANALLCRVGSYYHDIGKTRRPIFFKENQMDQPNPHDGMEPQISAAILAAHVRDGVAMAEKQKLPLRIRDLIAQHHGDSQMAYFYYKAKEQADAEGREIDPADFSYDGPKPQTKEAAILMMADTVEAASRTLKERSVEAIEKFVHNMVRGKLDAGQLDEAPLTFRELEQIEQAFVKTLTGIYHERIEYPKLDLAKDVLPAGKLPAEATAQEIDAAPLQAAPAPLAANLPDAPDAQPIEPANGNKEA